VDLARDCLDKEVFDRHGERMARIDGIVIELDGNRQPRVTAIEIGAATRVRRLDTRFARWIARLAMRLVDAPGDPYRIRWPALRRADDGFHVDVDATDTPARASENWLREHVIGRIRGS
jgi:hypothetical protein